jgi:protein O-mannosyl-transferase
MTLTKRIVNQQITGYWLLLLISVVVAALYWQTIHFGFVVDDIMVVSENKFVTQGIKGIPDIVSHDSMTGYMGNQPKLLEGGRYRPLSLVLFAVAHELFKQNPSGYHVINWLIYILTGILLFFLLKELFEPGKNLHFPLITGIAVLLFMIHPIHTEVVCNIKGNDEILALLFGLSGWLTAMKWADKPERGTLVLTCLLLFLSFMAKESSVPLVVAIPLSLIFFRNLTFRKALIFMLFLLLPVVVYFWIRIAVIGSLFSADITKTGIMNDPYIGASLVQKYATILLTILIYIKLLWVPYPLTHDYYPWQIPLQSSGSPGPWVTLILIVFLGYLVVKNWKSRPPWAFAILYFFITLSLVSNVFINVGTLMNERFLFIPSIALPVLVVWFMEKLSVSDTRTAKVLAWGIPSLLVPAFLYLSADRIPDWESNKTLDMNDVRVSRNSARANLFAGVALWQEILNEKNDTVKLKMIEEARIFNDRALAIYPEYTDALKMKTGYASEVWKINKDLPALLKVFEEAMSVMPVPFVEEFVNWLMPRSDKNLMVPFLYRVGYEQLAKKQKNFPEALKYLTKGYQLNDHEAGILFGLCIISGLSGNHQDAVTYGNRYVSLFGKNEEIQNYVNRSAGQLSIAGRNKLNIKTSN